MSFKVTRDALSPALAKMAEECRDPRAILEAMGNALVGVTKGSFNIPSLRAAPWAPMKKQGGAPLKASGALWHSIRITSLESREVTVGTDRTYASYQQFGTRPYTIRPKVKTALFWPGAPGPRKGVHHPGLPPRPFFPFDASGNMTAGARKTVEDAGRAKLAKILRGAGGNPA